MAYPENNEKNRRELVENIISGWDVEDLYKFVVDSYANDYLLNPSVFEDDWDDFKDSYEWSAELRDSMKEDCPNPGCYCMACEKDGSDIKSWQVEDATNGRR